MSDTAQASTQNDFWNNRAFKIIVGYLVGSWTLLEFLNFILERLQFSPYWTEIFLYTLLLFLPSLLIMVFVPKGHAKKIVRVSRQYFLYVNIVIIGVILFFMFSSRELGAMTAQITYADESSANHTSTVVKRSFIKNIIFHKLEAEDGVDSLQQWMSTGIPKAVEMNFKQYQGTNLYCETKELSLKEKLESLSTTSDYIISGTYAIQKKTYSANLKFYNDTGMIHEETVMSRDFFLLADDIKHLILKITNPVTARGHIDLPFSEFVTDDLEAFEYFNKTNYRKASEEDPDFSYAYLYQAWVNFYYGWKDAEHKIRQTQKAMEKAGRLPEFDQLRLKAYYFSALGEEDKTIALLRQSLALNPGDSKAQGFFISFLASKGYDQEAIDYYNNNYHVNNAEIPLLLMKSYGQTEQARALIKKLGDAVSVFDQYKHEAELSLLDKNYDRAIEYFDNAKLEEPLAEKIDSMIKVTRYMQKIGADGLRKFASRVKGVYLTEARNVTFTVDLKKNILTWQPHNQERLPIYPIDSNSYFCFVDNSRCAKVTHLPSAKGHWNKFKFVQKDDLIVTSQAFLFRMTEDLSQGLKSFEEGDYLLADSLLEKVHAADTLYYFLKGYREAIEYITRTKENILPFNSTKTFKDRKYNLYLEPRKDHYELGHSSEKVGYEKIYPTNNNWWIGVTNKSRKVKLMEAEEGWILEFYSYDHDLNDYKKSMTLKEVQ